MSASLRANSATVPGSVKSSTVISSTESGSVMSSTESLFSSGASHSAIISLVSGLFSWFVVFGLAPSLVESALVSMS